MTSTQLSAQGMPRASKRAKAKEDFDRYFLFGAVLFGLICTVTMALMYGRYGV